LADGRRREREHRTHRPDEGGAGDHRPERDCRMQLHGVGGDARREQVVLDLLIQDDERQRPDDVDGIVERRDDDRERACDIGADDGNELRDDPDPERERDGVGNTDDREGDPGRQRRERGEERARVDVPAGLVDGQLPGAQHFALALGPEE
jgi:hypothetical protein